MRVYAIWSCWSAGGFLDRAAGLGGGCAHRRFFHGFALSTHLWFEDGINDGFVAAVGFVVGFML